MGDFNLPDICWDTLSGTAQASLHFINCVNNTFLRQVVHEATRSAAILDLVLTSDEDLIGNVRVGEHLDTSDHNIVRFDLNIMSKTAVAENKTKILDFRTGDYEKFRNMLSVVEWEREFEGKNCFEMWEKFKSILSATQSQCFKMKAIRTENRKPRWWNNEIRNKIRNKRILFRKLKRSNRAADLEAYRKVRNELNQLIRGSKRQAEINLARNSNKDPKKFYSFYNFNKKSKKNRPDKI
jgi:hypothetical protein